MPLAQSNMNINIQISRLFSGLFKTAFEHLKVLKYFQMFKSCFKICLQIITYVF